MATMYVSGLGKPLYHLTEDTLQGPVKTKCGRTLKNYWSMPSAIDFKGSMAIGTVRICERCGCLEEYEAIATQIAEQGRQEQRAQDEAWELAKERSKAKADYWHREVLPELQLAVEKALHSLPDVVGYKTTQPDHRHATPQTTFEIKILAEAGDNLSYKFNLTWPDVSATATESGSGTGTTIRGSYNHGHGDWIKSD